MIYLLTFFISAFFFYLAENIREGHARSVINAVAVLLPCIVAGCRDYSVGIDVMIYAKPTFDAALGIDDPLYWAAYLLMIGSPNEPLYWWMPWIIAQFSDNAHWLLLATALLIIVPVYFAMKEYHKIFDVKIWLTMLMWYLVMYNQGLDQMRQSIAISFLFLAMAYLLEQRYRRFITFVVIATGFHSTGLIGIALFCLYRLLRQEITTTNYRRIKQLLILAVFSVLFLVMTIVTVQLLIDAGFLRSLYMDYYDNAHGYVGNFVGGTNTIIYMLYLGFAVLHYHILIKRRVEWLFFTVISFIIFVGQFTTLITAAFSRIFCYFYPYQVLSLCMLEYCYRGGSRALFRLMIVSLALAYWFYRIMIVGIHGTNVYIFDPSA